MENKKQIFVHDVKCVGASCPIKKHCDLYLNNAHVSRSLIRPEYKKAGTEVSCTNYKENFTEKVLATL